MKPYPVTQDDKNPTLKATLDFIQRERGNDIQGFNNLSQTYIAGRRVGKVPSSSTDTSGDAVGDFNVTAAYAYFCVNNGGTAEWVRVAVGAF